MSVRNAVPPGRMRSSAVGTCVCEPSTAATRPSRWCASAAFSLVASMCASTITIGRFSGMVRSSSSQAANGSSAGMGKVMRPSTVATKMSRLRSPKAGMRIMRLPGALAERLNGRRMGSLESSMVLAMRESRYTWSPSVTASAPASRKARYRSAVMPEPLRMFSPFTITASARTCWRSSGSSFCTAERPGAPTTSPRNRMRIGRAIGTL